VDDHGQLTWTFTKALLQQYAATLAYRQETPGPAVGVSFATPWTLRVATHRSGAITVTRLIESSRFPRRWSRGRSRRPSARRTGRARTVGARGDPQLPDGDEPPPLDQFQAERDAWDEIGLESLGVEGRL
jgi:hypothetical protein